MAAPYLEVAWRPLERRGDLVCVVEGDFDLAPWGLRTTIPAGYESDGMSVPRWLWASVGPRIAPRTIGPSIAHDWLYTRHCTTRAEADAWYREALRGNGYPAWRCWEVWLGVRLGGGSHWS